MKRRHYANSAVLDIDSANVNLIAVNDASEGSEKRSAEVIDLAAQMIRLASKRGRVKKSTEEAQDEAA